MLPAEGTPEIVREHMEAGRETVRQRVEELLVWGVEERGGPHGLDIELTSHALVAVGERLARLVLTDPEAYSPERVGDFIQTVVASLERPV